MRIISLTNEKGGVGKTTCTLNLGAALVRLNKKCLHTIYTTNNLNQLLRAYSIITDPDYKGALTYVSRNSILGLLSKHSNHSIHSKQQGGIY